MGLERSKAETFILSKRVAKLRNKSPQPPLKKGGLQCSLDVLQLYSPFGKYEHLTNLNQKWYIGPVWDEKNEIETV